MKKVFSLLLACVLALALLSACGGYNSNAASGDTADADGGHRRC